MLRFAGRLAVALVVEKLLQRIAPKPKAFQFRLMVMLEGLDAVTEELNKIDKAIQRSCATIKSAVSAHEDHKGGES